MSKCFISFPSVAMVIAPEDLLYVVGSSQALPRAGAAAPRIWTGVKDDLVSSKERNGFVSSVDDLARLADEGGGHTR